MENGLIDAASAPPRAERGQEGMMGGGWWRDRENHHPAEQLFREMEGDAETGGLEPCSAHHLVPPLGPVILGRVFAVWYPLL